MKTIKFLSVMVFFALLVACNSKGNKTEDSNGADSVQTITAIQKISGPLGQYFEAVPKEYKVIDGKVLVEIKRIKEGLPEPWKEGIGFDNDDPCTIDIRPYLCDKDGNVVREVVSYPTYLSVPEMEELAGLPIDDTFSIGVFVEEGERQVKFKSTFKFEGKSSSDADDEEETEAIADDSSSKSSSNYDELLKSYEKYVDKYISLMKKAKAGDASALSEYPNMLEEAQSLSEKIQNVQGDLTAEQAAKYQRLSAKMLKAAQELQ